MEHANAKKSESQKVLEAERQTRDKWQKIIHEWRHSDITASAYCREQQLNIHKFKYWQYPFAPETKKQHQLKRPLFSQVQITKTNPVSLKQESSVTVFELIIREKIKLQIEFAGERNLMDPITKIIGI